MVLQTSNSYYYYHCCLHLVNFLSGKLSFQWCLIFKEKRRQNISSVATKMPSCTHRVSESWFSFPVTIDRSRNVFLGPTRRSVTQGTLTRSLSICLKHLENCVLINTHYICCWLRPASFMLHPADFPPKVCRVCSKLNGTIMMVNIKGFRAI